MSQTKPLIIFLALVVAFAAFFEAAIVTFGPGLLTLGLMWSVGLSAMLALKMSGHDLSSLGWKWGAARYHLIAFAMPILYGGIAYFGAGAAGLITFPSAEGVANLPRALGFQSLQEPIGFLVAIAVVATIGMVTSMSSALGEEIGWRGFLTPRLTALTGFVWATLITGLIWAAWHLPMVVLSNYNAGGDRTFEIASFVVMVVAGSGVYAWLRLESGSLWPAATLHASHNLFIQSLLDPLTTRGENSVTMVSEFGVVLAAVCVLASLPFWFLGARRFGRVATASGALQPAS